MRWFWAALIWTWGAMAVVAQPEVYRLDGTASRITFTFDVEGVDLTGQVPITAADLVIDFQNLGATRARVAMDVSAATTNLPFATEAMRAPSMLNTGAYPQATFVSTRVTPVGRGARLEGDLTLRGVTRPVVLDGAIFRKRGSDPGDLSDLVLIFEGRVDRHVFGASAYRNLVGAEVRLRILAAIVRE